MSLTLAILAAILFGLAGWWMKMSQMNNGSITKLMIGMYLIGTLCFAIHTTVEGSFATLTDYRALLLGVIIGLGSGLGNYLFMKALERGPASLISPLTNTNIIIVVLLGLFIYDESLSIVQLFAIICLIIATILISVKKRNGHQKTTQSSWLIITLVAILLFACRNGGLKVAEAYNLASAPILFVAYLLSLVLFMLPIFKKNEASTTSTSVGWKFGMLTGVFSYAGLQLFAISLTYGQASIIAPIFATNGLIVTIGSILIYKERLTFLQSIAFILLFIGLIGIKITL